MNRLYRDELCANGAVALILRRAGVWRRAGSRVDGRNVAGRSEGSVPGRLIIDDALPDRS
jgi:hypothetical protein